MTDLRVTKMTYCPERTTVIHGSSTVNHGFPWLTLRLRLIKRLRLLLILILGLRLLLTLTMRMTKENEDDSGWLRHPNCILLLFLLPVTVHRKSSDMLATKGVRNSLSTAQQKCVA